MSTSAGFIVAADVCGVISGALSLAGYWPDIRRTWRGLAKPPRLAWMVWTIQYGVLLSSQIAKGGIGFWLCLPALQLLGTATMAVLSVRTGGGRIDPLRDMAAAGAAGAALALWWETGNAVSALVIVLVVEGAGMAAVAWHAFKAPHEETMWIWRGCAAGGVFGVVAVLPTRSMVLALYPVCFTVMAMAAIIAHRIGTATAAAVDVTSSAGQAGSIAASPGRMA
jgi:hypothetical protein